MSTNTLTQADHGKAIATAIKLVGKPGQHDDPIRVELSHKGVTAYSGYHNGMNTRGKNRSVFMRYKSIDLNDCPVVGGIVLRDILKLSGSVEIQDVNINTVAFTNNGCKWELRNYATPQVDSRGYFSGTKPIDPEPIREIARIPIPHLEKAIKAGYKRAYKPAHATIVIAGKYELPCREIESFLAVKEVADQAKVYYHDLKFQVWECHNGTLRYGIMGLWITTPAKKHWKSTPCGNPAHYWLKTWGDTWSGFTNMLSAWEFLHPKYNVTGNLGQEEPIILKTFWGSEITVNPS